MDKLGVINLALLKAGLPLAASLESCDYNAELVMELMAEEDLRAHPWGFATRYAMFEPAPDLPCHGYAHAYLKPADCLRMIDVRYSSDIRSPRAPYAEEGNRILTSGEPCYGRYVRRALDPADWPPDFSDVVACHIACEIAGLSAEKMSMVPQLTQLYMARLSLAIANDSREITERVPLDESLYQGRG